MGEYDTFVLKDLTDLKEKVGIELNIRSLEPGHYKYEAKIVKAEVSSDADEFPDKLWIRFQKGELQPEPWSIKILEEVDRIPKQFL